MKKIVLDELGEWVEEEIKAGDVPAYLLKEIGESYPIGTDPMESERPPILTDAEIEAIEQGQGDAHE